ncbi:hypothetical protein WJX72_009374 [[Myrmecia] bisecta]|uniref:VASt domain-containing protein n=1 Tax=[Myrmecia] bisecta TaxID=41462 RepID=A0AAW1PXZ5_9CHLO
MVKEVVESVVLQQCSVKEFHEAIFAGTEATLQYHLEANKDPKATVGRWEAGVRLVTFTVPLQLPAVVKSAIGQDSLPIKETQQLRFEADGSLVVDSAPLLDIPGGSKFTTSARFVAASTPTNGCRVTATIICSAAGPWGMQGKIEAVMVDQARITIGAFLTFCQRWCQQHKAEAARGPTAAVPAPATPPLAAEGEQFYDAMESESVAEAEAEGNTEEEAGPSSQELVLAAELGFEQAVLLYMRHLHVHSQQTCRLLEAMDSRLHSMEANIAAVRGVVAPHRRAAVQKVATQQPRWPPVSGGTYIYWGMGLAATACAVSATVYYRRRSS